MPRLISAFDVEVQGATELKAGRKRELVVTSGRRILGQDLSTGKVRTIASGFQAPTGVVATARGDALYVADLDLANRRFVVHLLDLTSPVKGRGTVVVRAAGQPGQLALDAKSLYYADGLTGTLVAVDLKTHKRKALGRGLQDPAGVCVGSDGRVYVAERGDGRIVSIAPGEPRFTVERLGVAAPEQLTRGTHAKTLLVPGFRGSGQVELWNTATNDVEVLTTMSATDHPIAAWQYANKLVAVEAAGIRWWDILTNQPRPVELTATDVNPFIGAYVRVRTDLGTSGLAFEDLEFTLPDGEPAGTVSYSTDDESAPNEVMLLVGYQPGQHTLQAVDRTTMTVVASLDFEITDRWADPDASPAHWSIGELSSFTTGYTWGGGPGVPQNVDVIPQSGTRNLCIVMVDVTDSRYPTGATFDTLKTHWSDGAVGPAPSARVFYEEVSHGAFTLSRVGSSVPYVALTTSWSGNFSAMPTPWPANSFAPTNNVAFAQACISAAAALTDGGGNPLVDFSQVQSLILVVRSKGTAGTDDFFWPQAWGGSFTIPGGSRNMNVLGMPDDWDTVRDSRTIPETLSHELGHNLGYPDLYTNANSLYSADVQARDVTNYDLMSREGELPHMSIAQKMETGWVRPEWVMPFDFSRSTIPLDQTVTLHPVELGAPPSGQFNGVEVRIADGWNYYFEYRLGETGQIGDQLLGSNTDSANGAVLGTDVISQSFTFPIARPQVMRLRPDAEGEDSFFAAGQDYKETDTSSMAVADFKMSVLSTSSSNAQVRIQYGTNGRPDLYIRPWPGGDNWQSPDIEVRNARTLADPSNWANTPWVGHANTVIARYRNRGPVTCRNVKVDFFVKDYTVSGGPEVWIGSDTHDVPPETATPFVEFTANWVPPTDGHKCIIVRTPLYLDASVNPNIVEISDSNNSAQSNYTRYIAASSSPAKRGIADVTLNNPFDKRAEIYVIPQITGPFADLYRLYMEHASLKLDPGESRKVKVMVESLYGDPRHAERWERVQEKLFYTPTKIALVGYGVPADTPEHPALLGGVQLNVSSARATRFKQFGGEPAEGTLRGQVVVVASGAPAAGFVLVTFHGPGETEANTITVPLDQNGNFFLRAAQEYVLKFQAKSVSAHYPGRPGLAPCDPDGGPISI